MNRMFVWILPLLLVLGTGCSRSLSTSSIPSRPDALGKESIAFQPPQPEVFRLANGIEVFYLFDDEVPTIQGSMYFPGGSLFEPAELAGVSSALGLAMRDGSIVGVSPEVLDKRLDDLAASIESDFGDEFGQVSFSCLAEDFSGVFRIFSQVIQTPAFDAGRLQLWKQLTIEAIKHRRDRPDAMAKAAFQQAIYGAGSPYARDASVESIQRITRSRLVEFHKRFVVPQRAILTIVGAVPRAQLEAELQKQFGEWKVPSAELPPVPKVNALEQSGIYVLERKFDQATVLIGHLGPQRHEPDVFPLLVYSHVFGASGFSSTLFNQIRSELGLAYSVYASFIPGVEKGVFQMYAGTRSEQVLQAVESMLRLAAESIQQSPNPVQFDEAKAAIEKSFVFRFAKSESIVTRAALQRLMGYPPEYDRNYLTKIAAVSPEVMLKTAVRWLHPERFVTVVVGSVSAEDFARAFAGRIPVYRLSFDTEPHVLEKLTQ